VKFHAVFQIYQNWRICKAFATEYRTLSNNINLGGRVYDNGVLKNVFFDSTNITNCFIDRSKECIDRKLCPLKLTSLPPSTQQTEEQRKVESVYWLIPFSITLVFSGLVVYYVYTKKNKGNPSMESKSKLENKSKLATIGRQPKLPDQLPPPPPPAGAVQWLPPPEAPEQSQSPPTPAKAPEQSPGVGGPQPGQSQWPPQPFLLSISKDDQESKNSPQDRKNSKKSPPTENGGLSPNKILAMCSY
jgi:hypothetical protein